MAQTISTDILNAALAGLRLQEQKIQEQIAQVESMLGGESDKPESADAPSTGKRRKFSAAARRHMKEAQRRRWAAIKGTAEQPETAAPVVTKAKRKMSASARKAIGEATRQRWALKKNAAEAAQATKVSKKVAVKGTKKAGKVVKKSAPVVKKSATKKVSKRSAQAAAPGVAAASV